MTGRNLENTNVNAAVDPSGVNSSLEVDSSGNLKIAGAVSGTIAVSNMPTVFPAAAADSYTLAYNVSNQLTSITRASDSKAITFTWTSTNLTGISNWA